MDRDFHDPNNASEDDNSDADYVPGESDLIVSGRKGRRPGRPPGRGRGRCFFSLYVDFFIRHILFY